MFIHKNRLIWMLTCLLTLFFFGTAGAQDSGELSWFENLETAKKAATPQGKTILLYFSGSDWCRPCILLNRDVLKNENFSAAAARDFVIVQLDFPSRKKNRLSKEQTAYNESLAEKYNPDGNFPLIVAVNIEGNVLGRIKGYQQETAEDYLEKVRSLIGNLENDED